MAELFWSFGLFLATKVPPFSIRSKFFEEKNEKQASLV